MGLPIFESLECLKVKEGEIIDIDADAGLIGIIGSDVPPLTIEPVPPFMQELIADGGLMRHIALKKEIIKQKN